MRTKLVMAVCFTGLAMSGWASSAAAHHAFAAEFDANKPVNFTGTITKMEWVNPHCWLHISVKQPDGAVVSWAIEAGTPNVLFRRGFTKDTLQPGLEVVVDGYQSKDGSRRNGRDLTFLTDANCFSAPRNRRSLRVDAWSNELRSRLLMRSHGIVLG